MQQLVDEIFKHRRVRVSWEDARELDAALAQQGKMAQERMRVAVDAAAEERARMAEQARAAAEERATSAE
jgi:hypothetical protein